MKTKGGGKDDTAGKETHGHAEDVSSIPTEGDNQLLKAVLSPCVSTQTPGACMST